MPKIKNVAILSFAVLIAQAIASWAYNFLLGMKTQQLFAIQPATGIGGQVVGTNVIGAGNMFTSKVLGFANSPLWTNGQPVIAGYSLMSLLAMYIGIFLLILIGFWVYEQNYIKVWQGRDLMQRLFAVLLYGHIALYALLLMLGWGVPGVALNIAIGLAINLVVVSAIVTASAKYLDFPRV